VDDKTQRFLYVLLGIAAVAMAVDAFVANYQIDPSFWGFLTVIVGLIATLSARRNGKNGV
jgi:hypothetical protein